MAGCSAEVAAITEHAALKEIAIRANQKRLAQSAMDKGEVRR
jgi:hypothetical protein